MVRGLRVRYRADGAGTPVVLLHGIGRDLEDWSGQHQALSSGFRVYSADRPGLGESDPLREPYSLEALGRFVGNFLTAAGESRPAHIAGNSLGGAVAIQLAVPPPDRIRSLVLVDSAGFGSAMTPVLRLIAVRPLGMLLLRPSRVSARRTVRAPFGDPAFVTEDRVRHALQMARRPGAARAFQETGSALATWRGMRPE
jgi:pimeloyl-ACP methyl ester carboxylesterase